MTVMAAGIDERQLVINRAAPVSLWGSSMPHERSKRHMREARTTRLEREIGGTTLLM
jgi:hypothetical protein